MRSGGNKASFSDAFVQCSRCKKTLFKREFDLNASVCPHCDHHHRLNVEDRLKVVFDDDSFQELDLEISSVDTLQFSDYQQKLDQAIAKTGRKDGMVSGRAAINGQQVFTAVSDFSFMGGSMGSVAGEKVTRTFERASDAGCAAIIFCASGGARMQEGLLSLMQMAKTTAAVERCRSKGVATIAVFTDPTMAGVLASYASIVDVILAEPKSLIGFAGTRVSKQAQVVKAPDDFQTAEFAYKHGMIDKIVHRRDLRETLGQLVYLFGGSL